MTIAATGIGRIPQFRPTQRLCRHCLDPYMPKERGSKYCEREPCQAAKRRREREKARERERRRRR